jgi:hypothetical protein
MRESTATSTQGAGARTSSTGRIPSPSRSSRTVRTSTPVRTSSTESPFPAKGGHVTVRVMGFDEGAHPPGCWSHDLLGRFDVVLARMPDGSVSVSSRDGTLLGHLTAAWAHICDRELWQCESAGRRAVARATLTGPKGERDLCVLLAWPSRLS